MVGVTTCIVPSGISSKWVTFIPSFLSNQIGRVENAGLPKLILFVFVIYKAFSKIDLVKKIPFIPVGKRADPFFE